MALEHQRIIDPEWKYIRYGLEGKILRQPELHKSGLQKLDAIYEHFVSPLMSDINKLGYKTYEDLLLAAPYGLPNFLSSYLRSVIAHPGISENDRSHMIENICDQLDLVSSNRSLVDLLNEKASEDNFLTQDDYRIYYGKKTIMIESLTKGGNTGSMFFIGSSKDDMKSLNQVNHFKTETAHDVVADYIRAHTGMNLKDIPRYLPTGNMSTVYFQEWPLEAEGFPNANLFTLDTGSTSARIQNRFAGIYQLVEGDGAIDVISAVTDINANNTVVYRRYKVSYDPTPLSQLTMVRSGRPEEAILSIPGHFEQTIDISEKRTPWIKPLSSSTTKSLL